MVGECLVLDESRTNVDDPRDDEKRIDDIYRRAPKTDAIRVDPRQAAWQKLLSNEDMQEQGQGES